MRTDSPPFDQQTLNVMREHDPVVQRYRAFFALIDLSSLQQRERSGSTPHLRPTSPP